MDGVGNSIPDWTPSLSMSNPEIDQQHQQLIAMARAAIVSFEQGTDSAEKFHTLLNDLAVFAAMHFDTEERLLIKNGCPTLDSHRAEHERYREQLIEIMLKAMAKDLDKASLTHVLVDWITHNLLETDVASRDYMAP